MLNESRLWLRRRPHFSKWCEYNISPSAGFSLRDGTLTSSVFSFMQLRFVHRPIWKKKKPVASPPRDPNMLRGASFLASRLPFWLFFWHFVYYYFSYTQYIEEYLSRDLDGFIRFWSPKYEKVFLMPSVSGNGWADFIHIQYLILSVIRRWGSRGSVVGCWGTMLQAGRSRARIPIRSLDFLIDQIIPAALWLWCRLSL
jgi:hypothetical protein